MDAASSGEPPAATPVPGTLRTTCPYCGVGCGVLATPVKAERSFLAR